MRLFAFSLDEQQHRLDSGSGSAAATMPSLGRSLAIIVGGIATFFCVFANLLTIFVLVRHRPLQKSISNLYILSLSVADVFIGIAIMSVMFANELVHTGFQAFVGPDWLCQTWQLLDFILSTISLYSTCAIALDRVWNLEKPLRVFKRSRRIAQRMIVAIWLLPVVIWVPLYFVLYRGVGWEQSNLSATGCQTPRANSKLVPIIAVPVLYVPSLILIAMFVRISIVVHKHLKFLREHSGAPQANSTPSPCQERNNSSCTSNSIQKDYLRTPDQKRPPTYDSLTTVTTGYCTTTLRTPRSTSPWFPRSAEYQLAPLSEEKSSGRERSLSEQINLSPDAHGTQQVYKISTAASQSKIDSSAPTRKQSVVARQLLLMQRAESFFRKHSSDSLCATRVASCRSYLSSADSVGDPNAANSATKLFRKISTLSRTSSRRFSVIPSNLAELLHREGVSHQVKAAKAVALISCCFLICWFPFLIFWPIKIYCPECISDDVYRGSIWLNYVCSTINPILYTLSSPRVRSALKSYVDCMNYTSKKAASLYKSNTVV